MPAMAELVFLNGDLEGDSFVLGSGRTVVGRQVGDLLVPDTEVSSIHAIISFERGGWYVMDLGSTNGVYVGEQMRLEARLKDGEELRLGKTRMRFRVVPSDSDQSGGIELDPATAETGPIARQGSVEATLDHRDPGEQVIDDLAPGRPNERVDTQKMKRADLVAAAAGADSVQITLEIVEGRDRGSVRRFKQESILIGRLNTDLVLRDSDVSRRHAIIEVFDATQVYLRDLNSTNGCRVNGDKVISARLQNGDELEIGRCVLRFSARALYSEES